jgi:hypothetical protein
MHSGNAHIPVQLPQISLNIRKMMYSTTDMSLYIINFSPYFYHKSAAQGKKGKDILLP